MRREKARKNEGVSESERARHTIRRSLQGRVAGSLRKTNCSLSHLARLETEKYCLTVGKNRLFNQNYSCNNEASSTVVEKGHSCHCVDRLEGKATMEVCNGSLQWKSAMEVVCGESHDHVIEQEQTYQINLQCYGPAYRPLGVGVVINYGGPSNLVIVGRCDKQEKMGYVVVKDIAKLESYQCMSTFRQVTRHLD